MRNGLGRAGAVRAGRDHRPHRSHDRREDGRAHPSQPPPRAAVAITFYPPGKVYFERMKAQGNAVTTAPSCLARRKIDLRYALFGDRTPYPQPAMKAVMALAA